MIPFDEYIKNKEIIICAGPGGAGKTTVSAALALAGAVIGRNTLALTIDPAKRLATSLGISTDTKEETQISERRFKEAGLSPKGILGAAIPDVKKTFDELIKRVAPSDASARKILSNKYYQGIADSLAGTQEYMAMEKLFSMYEKREYDLIVLDTPPSRHALDFLDAPKRLINLLEAGPLKWLLKPYFLVEKLSFGFSRLWTDLAIRALEKIVGIEVIHDIWEFFKDFEDLNEPFKKRAKETYELLRSPRTVFLIVTSPVEFAIYESLNLYKRLSKEKFLLGGVVINRAFLEYDFPASIGEGIKRHLSEHVDLAGKIMKNYQNYRALAASDTSGIEKMRKKLRKNTPLTVIPFFDTEIYDIEGLARVVRHILQF